MTPSSSVIRKITRKMQNRIVAMAAALTATPPKPKTAAMIAMMKK
jgi:hypothetical protein